MNAGRLLAQRETAASRRLLDLPFFRHDGGYAVFARFPEDAIFDAIYEEAVAQFGRADRQHHDDDDLEEVRGGTPARRLWSAGAGPAQDRWYLSTALSAVLSEVCRARVCPSGTRGSYSYYAAADDHLALHRDIPTCDLTVITCLYDSSDPADPGGALVLYPQRAHEPLSAIRARPDSGAIAFKLPPRHSLVMIGGLVPHCVQRTSAAQTRIVSALCFAIG